MHTCLRPHFPPLNVAWRPHWHLQLHTGYSPSSQIPPARLAHTLRCPLRRQRERSYRRPASSFALHTAPSHASRLVFPFPFISSSSYRTRYSIRRVSPRAPHLLHHLTFASSALRSVSNYALLGADADIEVPVELGEDRTGVGRVARKEGYGTVYVHERASCRKREWKAKDERAQTCRTRYHRHLLKAKPGPKCVS